MSIWDLCIKRPVFTVMLISAPLTLGLISYFRLGVDLLPNVELPIVTVTTTLRGASVEEMETTVTKPLEEIINTVSSIDELRSTTREGISRITVQFLLEKNRDVAAQEVRDKISTIIAQLPDNTDPPIIDKMDVNAMPVLTIAVSGDRPVQEVTEIARKRIKEDLESVSGVGAVIVAGGRKRAINVYVDTDKLTSYNLSVEDVRQALVRQNLELPGGRVDQGPQELVLRTMGRVASPAEFADLIIANQNGYLIRVADIGRVEDSYEEPRGLSRLDGSNAVSLIVQKQSGDNTVEVVDRVKARLERLKTTLPPDIKTFVVRDQSRFIKLSIEEVQFHLLIAALLVGSTILLFIRDWRTTIIATLSIPVSLITTFSFMSFMGFTLNNFTMLGLILAVGIVIDDAVVIHENIFRHMEEYNRKAREAAGTATREIALAVMATTFSLLVIFIPVILMPGRIGKFFSSFGATVAFAIFASMCVSFTMTPMLCSRFLVLKGGHKGSKSGIVWRAIDGFYGLVLGWSMRHRWVIVLVSVGLLASIYPLFRSIGFDFMPRDDQSEFEVSITLREGYSLQRADNVFAEIEGRLRKLPGVLNLFTMIGDTTGRVAGGQGDVTSGSIYVRMVDLEQRVPKWTDFGYWMAAISGDQAKYAGKYYSQFDVMRKARAIVREYDFRTASVQDAQSMGGMGGRQSMIDLNLRGPDLGKLEDYSEKAEAWMDSQSSTFLDVDTSLSMQKPELRVMIDRQRAADLGIPIQAVASTLNMAVGGEQVTKYKEFDEQYDVWLRAELPFRDKAESIEQLMIPAPKAGLVQLSSLASLVPNKGPAAIDHFAMQRQVIVRANLEVGVPLGVAVQQAKDFVESMNLPADYRYEFLGRAKMLGESNIGFAWAFVISFIFMYMILAAQFESFVHPVTILLALPLTLPFAIISLMMLRTNLDTYAMFGLFMLFGIVKKNGILQVDYTNVLRAKGLDRYDAIMQANHTRLRPILMTTVMLIAAMVPIALGRGPGAAARASLAKVILGGQSLSLLLTLLVTPVAYSLWDDLGRVIARAIAQVRGKPKEAADAELQPTAVALAASTSVQAAEIATGGSP
jgi:hydrophobic/amphiphilic exporter-1 (mainly G- bacteria), HAE1 family